MRTLGVLLAGGRGARMQSPKPKALVMCAGRSLLARALATLEALCDPVVVVAPADMQLPVPPAQRIADLPGVEGPFAGFVAGMGSRRFEEALVLAVDMPLVTPALLTAVRSRRGEAAAVLPAPGGVPQPLAAWYAPCAFPTLAAALAAGERSISRAVMSLSPMLLADAELAAMPGGLEAWLNVNTPDDLARAEQRIESGRAA